jgi:molybdate-binding protein/DNA-binding HxlR family transcriptional regulator
VDQNEKPMPGIELIKSLEQIKLLSDARRLAILRLLVAKPATLTQLGAAMGEHPAWVRHHLKQLEEAGLVEMVTAQASGGFIEKYYQAKARAFIFQQTILPDMLENQTVLLMGSHDLGLSQLASRIGEKAGIEMLLLPVGSLDGLVALRQGLSQLTACHLLDAESGEYNLPYVRHFFPDRPMAMVTLARRTQGLMVAPGNPRRIDGLDDLPYGDIVFINRNRGSGTRVWLDKKLQELGLEAGKVHGYQREASTHTAVAQAIRSRRADTGLGLEAAARASGLDFIQLFQERFDLVLPQETLQDPKVQVILDYLQSKEFRRSLEGLPGYEASHSGELLNP